MLDDEDDDLLALDDEATPPPPADDDDDDDGLAELLRMGDAGDSAASLEEEWQRRRAEMEDKAEKNAARAEKRRLQAEAEEAFARERGLGLLHTDPVCRGVVVCVTRGTSEDNATVVELTDALREERMARGWKLLITSTPSLKRTCRCSRSGSRATATSCCTRGTGGATGT